MPTLEAADRYASDSLRCDVVRLTVVAGWLIVGAAHPAARAARFPSPPQRVVETDTFTLHKLQQRVGSERYTLTATGSSIVLQTTSELQFLGNAVPLKATLSTDGDYRPRSLEISGATSTLTDTDARVVIDGDSASITVRGTSRRVRVDEAVFPITHYPPLALKQMLYRRWRLLGRPARMTLLPAGEVRFEHLGVDTVQVAERRVPLQRFAVHGVVWGMQSAWFDDADRLIAAVSGDAELDRFEGIRRGFEHALALFVRRSIEDGVAMLERAARTTPPVREGRYAIVGATLIDATGRAPIPDAVVTIEDGRITAAGPRASVRLPPNVPSVDARGKVLLPGLWDMHGHFEQVEWPWVSLASGVTTARDVANEFELVTALRSAIEQRRSIGPRILAAGVIDGGEQPLGVIAARDESEARSVVRRYKAAGFEQIKIYQSLPPTLVSVVADEAHKNGMTVTGHVPTGMNVRQFVEAGADQINHLNFVTPLLRAPPRPGQSPTPIDLNSEVAKEAIAFLRAHGTVIDPSLARAEEYVHSRDSGYAAYEPGVAKAPIELQEALNSTGIRGADATRAMASLERSLAIVAHLRHAGIPIVLGTDLSVPGHSIHRELELAVRGGMTPLEAIQSATLLPARAMNRERESGSVEVGKRADLLLLDADPLRDIRNIRRVSAVIVGGRWFEPALLWRLAGFQP